MNPWCRRLAFVVLGVAVAVGLFIVAKAPRGTWIHVTGAVVAVVMARHARHARHFPVRRVLGWVAVLATLLLLLGPWLLELAVISIGFVLLARLIIWPSVAPLYVAARSRLVPLLTRHFY